MCLNNSVISGKCPGCAALKAANERLAAAGQKLREELAEVGDHADMIWDEALLREWDAALSGAGRGYPQPQSRSQERRYKAQGWLPPEVREQVWLAIGHAFHLIEHNKAMCVRCREAKQRLSAAQDALKGE